MEKPNLVYGRVLLKIGGQLFQGEGPSGIDPEATGRIAQEIGEIVDSGVEVGVVVGGGNILRGRLAVDGGFGRVLADHMGMLATIINALALQDALERIDIPVLTMTAFAVERIADLYVSRRATQHLSRGGVVILAGGTGNPYFTTDTAAALRAVEMEAEVLLKGTQVEGIYTADPLTHRGARKYETLSHLEFLNMGLKVMDTTAVSFCLEHRLPIVVFNLGTKGNLRRVILGERVGTVVT